MLKQFRYFSELEATLALWTQVKDCLSQWMEQKEKSEKATDPRRGEAANPATSDHIISITIDCSRTNSDHEILLHDVEEMMWWSQHLNLQKFSGMAWLGFASGLNSLVWREMAFLTPTKSFLGTNEHRISQVYFLNHRRRSILVRRKKRKREGLINLFGKWKRKIIKRDSRHSHLL